MSNPETAPIRRKIGKVVAAGAGLAALAAAARVGAEKQTVDPVRPDAVGTYVADANDSFSSIGQAVEALTPGEQDPRAVQVQIESLNPGIETVTEGAGIKVPSAVDTNPDRPGVQLELPDHPQG